ncbi:alpha/beta fold hydrolase [Ramlibacter pallidus]|uniref:Alpha/beta hydrolase n=1 Tax=Ramlibacter pallidus TaxID=2780087 RepID=A0ABR9S000_9BURK|nr:alpha/beta hydrolase [Ramlibacter pallidus]MBE7366846.1 alpha/beta hydrolase [Ramlibacter pallidus]
MTVLNFLLLLLFTLAVVALFTFFLARRVTAAFPPRGQWLEVDGERLHYRSLGDGPPLVLVHGLAGESRNFDYLPLKELATRWRVVLVDRPGAGHSPRADAGKAGIAAQARLVAGFIRAMRFERKPLLVGHSLGGAIALSVALQEPEGIAGLALIAPLTHFQPHVPRPFRPMAIRTPWLRRLFAHTFSAPVAIANTPAAMAALFGPDRAPRDFAVRGGGLMTLRPSAFIAASEDMAAVEADLLPQQERYGEIRLPVHVLYGRGDRVLDWQAQGAALQAKLPAADLRVVDGGHMLPVTAAAATAAWLDEAARAVHGDLCDSDAKDPSAP